MNCQVDKSENIQVFTTRSVFSVKIINGEKVAMARLVVRVCEDRRNHFFDEVYSPVTSPVIIRYFVSLATVYDFELTTIDFKSASLYDDILYDVFISPPEGLKVAENKVLKLKKSLYGLRTSSRAWYEMLSAD